LLVRIQPEEPILNWQTQENGLKKGVPFFAAQTSRNRRNSAGAAAEKSGSNIRMVNEPDQLNLLPSRHSMHIWFAERSTAFGKRCATNRDQWGVIPQRLPVALSGSGARCQ
jgi:hypothetical protein